MDFRLKNISDIEGTHWIEFNISGTSDNYKHWESDSKFLDEYVYNLFTDIFERHTLKFNYYSNTMYDISQLTQIKKDIINRIHEFSSGETLDDLICLSKKTANALNLSDPLNNCFENSDRNLKKLQDGIVRLCQEMVAFFQFCIDQNRTLWILGL